MLANILTDSTADLGPSLAAEFGIGVVPLSVSLGDKVYQDGTELSPQQLYEFVNRTGQLPTTSAASVGQLVEAFDRPGECIYIGISSRLSATVQNAQLAAQSYPPGKVRVVDSLNLSNGIGLLALRAAELRDEGLSAAEIETAILKTVAKVRTSFVLETLDYLRKGGRCTALEAVVGSFLKIRPIIEVKADGTMGVREKARGTRKKALESLLADFEAQQAEADLHRVFVTHSGCPADAEFLAHQIAGTRPIEIRISQAGSVISSHCGPDTIGILYLMK